jgi:hypothetical protein
VYEYLQKDGSVMAKAGAITLGGMTGLLYGLRTGSCAGKRAHSLLGGTMRRVVMTGAGLGTMTAFCYPHETVRGVRHTWRTGREHFSQFVARTFRVSIPEMHTHIFVLFSKMGTDADDVRSPADNTGRNI